VPRLAFSLRVRDHHHFSFSKFSSIVPLPASPFFPAKIPDISPSPPFSRRRNSRPQETFLLSYTVFLSIRKFVFTWVGEDRPLSRICLLSPVECFFFGTSLFGGSLAFVRGGVIPS